MILYELIHGWQSLYYKNIPLPVIWGGMFFIEDNLNEGSKERFSKLLLPLHRCCVL